MTDTLTAILSSLGTGLPVLLLHFLTTALLLVIGVVCYIGLTPFHERTLIPSGNVAAGMVMGGSFVALAIPLAATLATSHVWLDIVLWGLVAITLQLVTFVAVIRCFGDLRAMIESGNTAAASVVIGVQIAVALLNAGAMAG